MLNIACTHACKCSFSYFSLLYATKSYSMTSVVVLFEYPMKLHILTRNGVTKILPKKLYCYFI